MAEHVRVERGRVGNPSAEALADALHAEGLDPFQWRNGPGYRYAPHDHPYHSVIVCVAGSIAFQVGGEEIVLAPGDRIDLGTEVEHAAVVGPEGVTCLEATVDAR